MTPADRRPDIHPEPAMQILDARTSTDHLDRTMLTVLVDRIPRLDELTYRVIEIGHVRPLPATMLYLGVHPDGYVVPLVDIGDGRGFYGQTLNLRTDDGTVRRVIGPYRAPIDLVRVFARDIDIRSDIGLLDDPAVFARHRDGSGALAACLTTAASDTALRLAIAHDPAAHNQPTSVPADLHPTVSRAGGLR
jgi:hypothetical protein